MLYADDTALHYSGKDVSIIENTIQDDLNRFNMWCNQNVVTVDVKKTKYVLYATSQRLKNT